MDINLVIVIAGVAVMPLLVMGIAKNMYKIRTGEAGKGTQINLNSIFKMSLLVCFICILFGVVWGTIAHF